MIFNYKKNKLNKYFQSEDNANYSGLTDLYLSEKYLINYNNYIVKLFSQVFSKQDKLLDFGAGIGTITVKMQSIGFRNIECHEIDDRERNIILKRGLSLTGCMDKLLNTFDGVFTSNVLEHIDDDAAALQTIRSVLKKNGYLAIYVPAFDILYSDLDFQMGHYRRYNFEKLNKLLTKSNFKIIKYSYIDSIGFFASFVIKIFGYHKTLNIGDSKSLYFYDRFVLPISSILDKIGLKKLFGKNIIVIAKAI